MDKDHDSKIEAIANMLAEDNVSLNEQDQQRLAKYMDFAQSKYMMGEEQARQLVNEAFLYLMLKNAGDLDPLQQGDKFGAGFS